MNKIQDLIAQARKLTEELAEAKRQHAAIPIPDVLPQNVLEDPNMLKRTAFALTINEKANKLAIIKMRIADYFVLLLHPDIGITLDSDKAQLSFPGGTLDVEVCGDNKYIAAVATSEPTVNEERGWDDPAARRA